MWKENLQLVPLLIVVVSVFGRVHRRHKLREEDFNSYDDNKIDGYENSDVYHHLNAVYDDEINDEDAFYRGGREEDEDKSMPRYSQEEINRVLDSLDEKDTRNDSGENLKADYSNNNGVYSGTYQYLKLKRYKRLTVIPTWSKTWLVSFRIKPFRIYAQYTNLFHFTIGGDSNEYGDRIPAVWFVGGSHRLHFASAINGNPNSYWDTRASIPTYKYTSVSISQKKNSAGKYVYSISLDGKQVYSKVNYDARDFRNVQLWASDKWYPSASASIRDFFYQTSNSMNNGPTFSPGDNFTPCLEERTNAICNRVEINNFRTIDGTCNNLQNPTWGATSTALRRIVDADYVDGVTIPRGFPTTKPSVPNANKVSRAIFNVEKENVGNSNGLTVLFMTFGQFLDHDLTEVKMLRCIQETFGSCPGVKTAFQNPCFPILFNSSSTACTPFGRSEPICPKDSKRPSTRQQLNELTAFVDASQIYGADEELSKLLRVLNDNSGELKVEKATVGDLLPLSSIPTGFSSCSVLKDVMGERTSTCRTQGGCSLVGDVRGDENIPLHSMHTLWLREHNRIARSLRKLNPSWKGEFVFQTTRKIVGALWQHVTYEEYLPRLVKIAPYSGYKSSVNPSIVNAFATAAFRYGHSLVPNSFQVNNNNFDASGKPIPLQEAFFNRQPVNFFGIENFIFGLLGNQSNEVDNSFAQGIARKLFVRPGEGFHSDLLALNIQRGRDHGIPTYGSYRKICNLPAIKSWYDLIDIMLPNAVDSFKQIYKHPNDIDLFAAGISEKHIKGLELGATFACLIGRQFEAARDGDRFFYRHHGVFTQSQLQAIENVKLSSVLCENLKSIVSIQPQALRVPDGYMNRRINCERIPKLDLSSWRM